MVGKFLRFPLKSPFIPETVQNREKAPKIGDRRAQAFGMGACLPPLPQVVTIQNLLVKLYERSAGRNELLASRFSRSLKVIGTDRDRSGNYDFLLTFHSNHGPFPRHNEVLAGHCEFFWIHVYLAAPLRGFLGNRTYITALGLEILDWWGYLVEKQFDDISRRCGYNTSVWREDGRHRRPSFLVACARLRTTVRCKIWSEIRRRRWRRCDFWPTSCDLTLNARCKLVNIMVFGSIVGYCMS